MVAAEDDSSLTAGDKAIARFQKQRMKELQGAPAQAVAESSASQTVLCSLNSSADCAASPMQRNLSCGRSGYARTEAPICCVACAGDKFALLDDDEEQLTHMGKSLAADDFQLVSSISPASPSSSVPKLLPSSVHESLPHFLLVTVHTSSRSKSWAAGCFKRLGSPSP